MYAFKLSTLAVLATMCTSAFATPAPLEARDDTANVRMFSGDTCNGAEEGFSVAGGGAYRCVPVTAARRSVIVTGRYVPNKSSAADLLVSLPRKTQREEGERVSCPWDMCLCLVCAME
jgi:FtsP/CotA-like multicopper oxidase with cupredoxin domain